MPQNPAKQGVVIHHWKHGAAPKHSNRCANCHYCLIQWIFMGNRATHTAAVDQEIVATWRQLFTGLQPPRKKPCFHGSPICDRCTAYDLAFHFSRMQVMIGRVLKSKPISHSLL
jgi:hypothetical protein